MAVWDWVFGLPTWVYIIIAFCLLLYLYGIWPYITRRFNFPGPPPRAFMGTVWEMFSIGVAESDSRFLKKYGDVIITWGMRTPQLLVGDPDMVKEILVKKFPNFVNRTITDTLSLTEVESKQLTILQDDDWKFVRATLSPAFSSGRLREVRLYCIANEVCPGHFVAAVKLKLCPSHFVSNVTLEVVLVSLTYCNVEVCPRQFVPTMVPIIQSVLDNLQDVIAEKSKDGKSIDTQELFKGYTLDAISGTAFGIDSNSLKNPDDSFAQLLKKLLSPKISMMVLVNMIFPFITKIMKLFKISSFPKAWQETVDVIARDVKNNIDQRKQHGTTRRDLLQLMIDARVDDLDSADVDVDRNALKTDVQNQRRGLTETEIKAQCFVFMLGGYATTAGTLSMLSYCLAMNPECQETLIEEIDTKVGKNKPNYENVMGLPYLDMCISEALRIYPAGQRLARDTKDDIVIGGHLIPKGLSIQIPVNYIHNNPKYWSDPEKFNPQRFSAEEKAKRHPYAYLPFGHGPRNCVGMRLALLKAKMAVVSILQRYRFVRSAETEAELKLQLFGFPEAVNGIWLKLEPRS
ncbi:cytochrome P450 3A6-like [Liolophura sinensis]|uniref:cytochrome P450 3A6-like n=1 Tax=Liolophura sinensis TaxID=3198878 RepID=UPI0031598B98